MKGKCLNEFSAVCVSSNNIPNAQAELRINIIEGRDESSVLIQPEKFENHDGRVVIDNGLVFDWETISIDDLDVFQFLGYFLEKYFDSGFPYEKYGLRDECCDREVTWNTDYGVYSYETMALMLQDIEQCTALFETDYKNAKLVKIIERFDFIDFEDSLPNRTSCPKEEESVIKSNIGIVTDFYRRFVSRMRKMIKNAPDAGYIIFSYSL